MKYYGSSVDNNDIITQSKGVEIAQNEISTAITSGTIKTELDKKINNPESKTSGQILEYNGTDWIAANKPTSGIWGQITGTLSDQTDLQTELNSKQDNLPSVVNDRYLHTNVSTGALEWSEVQSGGGQWGSITGTLSNQTDLQSALDAKQNNLPTATADKYLHTNASTNALEWIKMSTLVINADGSGTLVIPD